MQIYLKKSRTLLVTNYFSHNFDLIRNKIICYSIASLKLS